MLKDPTIEETKELMRIFNGTNRPLEIKIKDLEINNSSDMSVAAQYLSEVNIFADKLKKEKEEITKPLVETLGNIRGRYKPAETQLAELVTILRGKMSDYQTEQVRIQREEEDKIARRVGAGKGKLSVDSAVKRMEAIEKPEDKVVAESGVVRFKEVQKFEVMDMALLPKEYHLADEVAIRKAMLAGIKVEGVRYYTEQQPINFR